MDSAPPQGASFRGNDGGRTLRWSYGVRTPRWNGMEVRTFRQDDGVGVLRRIQSGKMEGSASHWGLGGSGGLQWAHGGTPCINARDTFTRVGTSRCGPVPRGTESASDNGTTALLLPSPSGSCNWASACTTADRTIPKKLRHLHRPPPLPTCLRHIHSRSSALSRGT